MKDVGFEVFYYEDESIRGQSFIDLIEKEIEKADLFVIVMSPDYLASYWCRRERHLALARESELGAQLIYVFQVADTPYARTGFMRTIDWFDLLLPITEEKLSIALSRLKAPGAPPIPTTPTKPGPRPTFHNRADEISQIVRTLTTAGGQNFFLVLAPPRMGKSWLLERVAFRIREDRDTSLTRLVDLRTYDEEFRADWVLVLCTLLGVTPVKAPALTPDDELDIAVQINRRGRPQLYLLDSAELMSEDSIQSFRRALTSIYRHLSQGVNTKTRLSVIVASRSSQGWSAFGRQERFDILRLTEFNDTVVRQAISELGAPISKGQLDDWSKALHKLSEGLPALLVAALRWAQSKDFMGVGHCKDRGVFNTIARPYISTDLLALPSLLPFADSASEARKFVLEMALRVLVPYRLFTQSHLAYHLEGDAAFEVALHQAGWNMDELWDALSKTALLKQQSTEIWQELNPPIRRLLYRYYYPDIAVRLVVHGKALVFYTDWGPKQDAKGQCVALLECLWHEAMKMSYDQVNAVAELKATAAGLTSSLVRRGTWAAVEVNAFVFNRIDEDGEFADLVSDELLQGVKDSIRETISAGGG